MENNELRVSEYGYRNLKRARDVLQAYNFEGDNIVYKEGLGDALVDVLELVINPELTVRDSVLINRFLNGDESVFLVNKDKPEDDGLPVDIIKESLDDINKEIRSLEEYGDPDSPSSMVTAAEYDGQRDAYGELLSGRYKEPTSYYRSVTDERLKELIDDWEDKHKGSFEFDVAVDVAQKGYMDIDSAELLAEIAYERSFQETMALFLEKLS